MQKCTEPDAPTPPKTVPSKIKALFSTVLKQLKSSEFSIFHSLSYTVFENYSKKSYTTLRAKRARFPF